jgi:hypothetical protein
MGMLGDPTRMSQFLRMVLMRARIHMDGSIFMAIEDTQFPLQIAERIISRAQSAATMKSKY